jgi:hypothetical protein
MCVKTYKQTFLPINVTVPSEWHSVQAENVVEKRDSKGSKKLRQKSSILPPKNGVKIVNEKNYFFK